MQNRDKTSKKIFIYLIIYSHLLAGCVSGGGTKGGLKTGPQLSSAYQEDEQRGQALQTGPRLDVIIPVFEPNLSETDENYEEGVWPELRRAEANRFSYKLKQSLDHSRAFGAVRVTPDATASGDLYVLGKIRESNGAMIEFDLNVVDSSGKEWLDKTFTHEVPERFYKNYRNRNQEPYAPIFQEAAKVIVETLRRRDYAQLQYLQDITRLRFGASFDENAFLQYLDIQGDRINLLSKPDDNDPILRRVEAIRVREQLFVDNLQQSYAAFSSKMDDSYLTWQEANFNELQLQKDARNKGILKAVGGALLIGLSVAAAVASGKSDNESVLVSTAVAGGLAGAWMLSSSFKSIEEAKLHKDAIDELGESLDLELAPRVVSFQQKSVELTGTIKQQFSQWRRFIKQIHEQEATPETVL